MTQRLIFALCTIAVFFGAMPAFAQWSTDPTVNNPISTASNYQFNPMITSDGAGGAIITWQDYRSGTNIDIYAQRIDAGGAVQWTTDGVLISMVINDLLFINSAITSDGTGGAIITWEDKRSGTNDIYAQRIDASGALQWTAGGVAISMASDDQEDPMITSDGAGGAIITWEDWRGDNVPSDVYAQRINAGGVVQWTADGVAISTAGGGQVNPMITSDGDGGAIITWQDLRSGGIYPNNIYAQRINAGGTVQWTADGVAISTAIRDQVNPMITSDGDGGAIITWTDARAGGPNSDIYAQRINAGGAVQWTVDGVAITTEGYTQNFPMITSDGDGGAIITWEDYRNGDTNRDIYAQHINAGGAVQWTADGVAISTASNHQTAPRITSDGAGGAIITWYDNRSGTISHIYAQHINAGGAVQWTADGLAVSTAPYGQVRSEITSDGAGGAIITWTDFRNGTDPDIYGQLVTAGGTLGSPQPQESIELLIADVDALLAAGSLNRGQANALKSKLENAFKKLNQGNTTAAINQLGAFINQVEAFINSGQLTAAEGQPLIDAANNTIDLINSSLAKQGNEGVSTGLESTLPTEFTLAQNYPNPFNPSTSIRFSIPDAATVQLTVYDISGREVRNLVSGSLAAGAYDIQWDATNNNGAQVASGIYIYRLQAGSFIQTRKMTLLK